MSLLDELRLYRPKKVPCKDDVVTDIREVSAEELLAKRASINISRIERKTRDLRQQEGDEYYKDDYLDYIKSIQFLDRKRLLKGSECDADYSVGFISIIFSGLRYKIYGWLRKKYPLNEQDPHEEIAFRVYDRLRLRNAQLRELEEQARGYLVDGDLKSEAESNALYDNKKQEFPKPGLRAYKLAVTDLFC